jgi:hypothetical protein
MEKINNDEMHNLNSSVNIIRIIKSRRVRWVGHIARTRGKINACNILAGKRERKTPFGRP